MEVGLGTRLMVQCISERHGKTPGGKTVGTRSRAGSHAKGGGGAAPLRKTQVINVR